VVSSRPLATPWTATSAALFAVGCAVIGLAAGPAPPAGTAVPWQTLTGGRVAFVERRGEALVADADQRRVVVFGPGGELRRAPGDAGPGRFGTIAALAVDGNLLDVADGARANVQTLLPMPESMHRHGDR